MFETRRRFLSNVSIATFLVALLCVLLAFTGDDTNEKVDGTTIITPTKKDPATLTLLDVPFYVYEDLFFGNATVGNHTLIEWLQYQREKRRLKHTDDYWFAIASLQHPLRTKDPSGAKLFVVPLITNQIMQDIAFYKLNVCVRFEHLNNEKLCQQKLLKHVDRALEASPSFQKSRGRNHILVASDYDLNS